MKYEVEHKAIGKKVTMFVNGYAREVTLAKDTPQAILKQLASTALVKEVKK